MNKKIIALSIIGMLLLTCVVAFSAVGIKATTNTVLANKLTADLKIREYPDGKWQDNSITVDVGTELEFKITAKSNRAYLSVTAVVV